MIIEKPSLDDVYLEHFGVKGMKWGQRKEAVAKLKAMNTPKNKAFAASGAIITASILHKTGHLKPLALGGGRLVLKGTGVVAGMTLNGLITVIGTPIHMITTLS